MMQGWSGKENRSLRTPQAALLPYQQAWAADMADVKIMEKSRRIGLSWAEAAEDALLAASENGMDVFYIGYAKDMAQEFIEDCADWARFYNLAGGEIEDFIWEDEGEEKKSIQAFRIVFPSGWKIVALSSRPRNLRGKQGKIVLDEAAFHDDLDGLIKAAMAMLIWGGRVVIISTHNGDESPFNELIQECRAGKKDYSVHRVTFDDALQAGLYQRVCLRAGKEWTAADEEKWRDMVLSFYGQHADEELFCVPARGSGVYFTRALLESCMMPEIPVVRLKCRPGFEKLPEPERREEIDTWCRENLLPLLEALDPNYPTYFGEDFGRTGDLTVIWPLQEAEHLTYRVPFAVELSNVPFEQQKQILYYIVDRLPRFRSGALDARGNGQYLAEVAMQKYGSHRIHQVMISTEW
ncbi:MAG: terminase family protein [Pseudomonadota bacterium]